MEHQKPKKYFFKLNQKYQKQENHVNEQRKKAQFY